MSTTSVETSESEIRDLIARLEAAMKAGDPDALVAPYAPDARTFDLAPPLELRGARARDAAAIRAWFEGFDGPVDFEVRDLEVTANGSIAFCHSLNRMSATPKGAPQGFDLWFRSTVCMERVGGEWLITHEHKSTPFYMDETMAAATDLKP